MHFYHLLIMFVFIFLFLIILFFIFIFYIYVMFIQYIFSVLCYVMSCLCSIHMMFYNVSYGVHLVYM